MLTSYPRDAYSACTICWQIRSRAGFQSRPEQILIEVKFLYFDPFITPNLGLNFISTRDRSLVRRANVRTSMRVMILRLAFV